MLISTLKGAKAYDRVGIFGIVALNNGNYVVLSPEWDGTGISTNAGAATWCNGTTGINGIVSTANSLCGSSSEDRVGNSAIALPNGNYVVLSYSWDNASFSDAGAITWCNGATGLTGIVNASNSLVGTTSGDKIGQYTLPLPNGNCVAISTYWDNGSATDAGAVTWINGNSGITGTISSANSLVGTKTNDLVGYYYSITILTNGNYVISSPYWDDGSITDVGAVTWGSGNAPLTGVINSANSLIGGTINDQIGSNTVKALSNGNYVVNSPYWKPYPPSYIYFGAVTWGNGATGTTGIVNNSNSLTGSQPNDVVGNGGVFPLSNGNYVVSSINWPAGAGKGAVTWCNGTTVTSDLVNVSNSLTGSTSSDWLGGGGNGGTVVPLTNGNYVVVSPWWDDGSIVNAGAVTWCTGTATTTATVSSANSLIGSTANDMVGSANPGNNVVNTVALTNGNYVVGSYYWDNGSVTDAGAVTWANGTAGITGTISVANSLVGTTANDKVGRIYPLTNGNFIINAINWDNGSIANAGAITWVNGSTGTTGTISAGNSLVGSSANDQLGEENITTLFNGNAISPSSLWDNGTIPDAGAYTWINGSIGITGVINSTNSLIGTQPGDRVGNGSYYVGNADYYAAHTIYWDNGPVVNAGATIIGDGFTGLTGYITPCNSVLGTVANGTFPGQVTNNPVYHYYIVAKSAENKIVLFKPAATTLADASSSQSQNISGTSPLSFYSDNCKLIATVQPVALSGLTSAKIWIEPSVPSYAGKPFVARHFEITPASNAAASTGRITLYFTQQDFDDFNADPGSYLDLPSGPGDFFGKANLKIGKYPGTSTNGTGLPGSYNQPGQIINPADSDIVWNSSMNRWEVSFNVNGFSGFIVQTNNFVLPISQLSFTAFFCDRQQVCLLWSATAETGVSSYTAERSIDGIHFSTVAVRPALNGSNHLYTVTDDVKTVEAFPVLYYRLRVNQQNGDVDYSPVEKILQHGKDNLFTWPNPVTARLFISEPAALQAVYLYDMKGALLSTWVAFSDGIDIKTVPAGVYVLLLQKKDGQLIRQRIIKTE
ncbi:MAG: T9SS type A sorting domain-containing protein [Ferruginibacter sp.]